jgi:mRNA interferase RelE/StbE
MSYAVVWTRKARKELLAIEKRQRMMILSWVERNLEGCADPKSIDGAKRLRGTDCGWRYRVGSYRILARLLEDEVVIEVVKVGHRQGVYSKLPKNI